MSKRWRITLGVGRFLLPYVGVVAGPLVLTIATVELYSLFDAAALRDGQFGMIYLVTVPFGLLLGGVAGASARLTLAHKRRAGGLCAAIGGSTVLFLAIVLGLLGGFPFGWLEILVILAVAGSLSIVGAVVSSSAVRAERWARYRLPLGERRPDS